jgi:peptidyl-prolyl cis-trans isomerase C
MSTKLDFSLPERKTEPPRLSAGASVLLTLILLAVGADLAISYRNGQAPAKAPVSGGLSDEAQKQLALRLEKQNLHDVAAEAWMDYVRQTHPAPTEAANVYYRIGKLHQEAREYARALESYYRSESVQRVPELEGEIGRRTQECLEAMGKFAALKHELSDRVGLNTTAGEAGREVVAEIGSQKISRAELDSRIETMIERQLAQFASRLSGEERRRQKEALLGQFSSAAQRLQFLNQFLMEEILYRKAREDKVGEDPEVRQMLMDSERSLLARRVLEDALGSSIKITPGDLTTYYEANKAGYVQPERARISQILVKEKPAAEQALKDLQAGKDFEELAAEISIDSETAGRKGEIAGWINKGAAVPGIGDSEAVQKAVFETSPGSVASEVIPSDAGYHVILVREKEPERLRPFDEVRDEVNGALRARKEREVQQGLLTELKQRYGVVIHQSEFPQEPAQGESK